MLGIAVLNSKAHRQWNTEDKFIRIDANSNELNRSLKMALDGVAFELQFVGDHLELQNHGKSLVLHSGPRIHKGCTTRLSLPAHLCVGETQFQLFAPEREHQLDHALTVLHKSPVQMGGASPNAGVAPSAETLASWFDSLGQLQRSAAGSADFFSEAAAALFNPGGLDGGIILIPERDGWKVKASYIPYPDYGIAYRADLIDQAARNKQTLYHDANKIDHKPASDDRQACIVCPVLDKNNEVAAIVYGFRSQHRTNNRRGIRNLEAQFVQVIADSMAAALTRLESEAEAARTRVLLEQAFAPEVARELETNPAILEGAQREVTVMFTDLRNFSTISEQIGPKATYQLMTDVMDHLSNIINDHDGVIIDYYGDGISAFWNAPIAQENHALLACKAALSILQSLPELNSIWSGRIGRLIRVGIGVHTGVAQVGNSGSSRRLKYGPRGTVVNLASRIENATKELGVGCLVSGEVVNQVRDLFIARRVCTTQLRGIRTPVDLWQIFDRELFRSDQVMIREYEKALSHFEKGQLDEASTQFKALQLQQDNDPVIQFMLDHIQTIKQYPDQNTANKVLYPRWQPKDRDCNSNDRTYVI